MFTIKPYLEPSQWEEFNNEHPDFETFLVWLGYINSLCNPIIYTAINRQYRAAFAKLLHLENMKPKVLSVGAGGSSI